MQMQDEMLRQQFKLFLGVTVCIFILFAIDYIITPFFYDYLKTTVWYSVWIIGYPISSLLLIIIVTLKKANQIERLKYK